MSDIDFKRLYMSLEHVTNNILDTVDQIDLRKTKICTTNGTETKEQLAELDGYIGGLLAARNEIVKALQKFIQE